MANSPIMVTGTYRTTKTYDSKSSGTTMTTQQQATQATARRPI